MRFNWATSASRTPTPFMCATRLHGVPWFGKDSEHPDSDYALPQLFWIFTRDIDPRGLPLARKGVDPLWVKRDSDASALLSTFGAARPYDDVALVAAFPMELLRTDGRFVIYRRFIPVPARPPYPVEMLTDGEIGPDELAAWR